MSSASSTVNRRGFISTVTTALAAGALPAAANAAASPVGHSAAGQSAEGASAAQPLAARWNDDWLQPQAGDALMPVPAKLSRRDGRMVLTDSFTVGIAGAPNPRLERAARRFLVRLARRTGLSVDRFELATPGQATLVLDAKARGSELPQLREDESYRFEVSGAQARLTAPLTVGLLRGLETALQWVASDASSVFWPNVLIEDRPRFAWRGLMIDCGRHFQPLDVLRQNLDAMATVKLNVLHWHLSEDQGFRIQSKLFPRLTELGSDGLFYTQQEARDLIAYAADRGIRVMPEFDMPGHCSAWLPAVPELGSGTPPYHIERVWGVLDNAFDPSNDRLYKFLDQFIGEMAALFPDPYLHIGGDENNGKQWRSNPRIVAFMKAHHLADTTALQAYFNRRLMPIVVKHGKKMVGWEEILNPKLPADAIVEAWKDVPMLDQIAVAGHQAILAAGYYLDLRWPTFRHYVIDPVPADTSLTAAQEARVLGAEACMWSEYTSAPIINAHIWPRTAAIAERFWSPREVRDIDDMYRRMALVELQIEELGLEVRGLQDRLLRALARTEAIEPLQVLLEAVEPNKNYTFRSRHWNQLTPLVFAVNAAPSESPLRRRLPQLVEALLTPGAAADTHAGAAARLASLFAAWRQVPAGFAPLRQHTPLLADIEPLAAEVAQLGELGARALAAITSKRPEAADWASSAQATLAGLTPAHGDLHFIVLAPLLTLVLAAAHPDTPYQTLATQAAQAIPKEPWQG